MTSSTQGLRAFSNAVSKTLDKFTLGDGGGAIFFFFFAGAAVCCIKAFMKPELSITIAAEKITVRSLKICTESFMTGTAKKGGQGELVAPTFFANI